MPVILVWPDAGQDDSDVREWLADVPGELLITTWDPTDDERGRTALLTSVRAARDALIGCGADPDDLTLIGFGRGAVAAAGLSRYAKRLGIGLHRVIAVAGLWNEPDPFSGAPLDEVPERVELVPDAYPQGARSRVLAHMLQATNPPKAGGAPG